MNIHPHVRFVTLALLVLLLPASAFSQSVVGVLGIAGEVAPIEKRLQDSRDVTVQGCVFREGTLNGRRVVVGRSPGRSTRQSSPLSSSANSSRWPFCFQERPAQSIRRCSLVMS